MKIPFYHGLTLGCDPELFISHEVGKVRKRKAIVGSEQIIPEAGLAVNAHSIVRDGVQVELHPFRFTCRAYGSNYLQELFRALHRAVEDASKRLNRNLQIDLSSMVRLSQGDLAKLSDPARQLGCMPSLNAYGRPHIQRDGTKYLWRSAAGHVHLGFDRSQLDEPTRMVHVLDVLVGNTMVLIDRDPLAIERRRTYGRAGEYRLPQHGLEYRTLSNFWLHNYRLFGLVMGLARLSFHVAMLPSTRKNRNFTPPFDPMMMGADSLLMKNVDLRLIEQAINTNDFDLAYSNYVSMVVPFLQQLSFMDAGLDRVAVERFDIFVKKIREAELAGNPKPVSIWFDEDPVKHWMNKPEGHNSGWETWLARTINPDKVVSDISGVVAFPIQDPYTHTHRVDPQVPIYDYNVPAWAAGINLPKGVMNGQ